MMRKEKPRTSFRADFSSEEAAEIFAEDWIMNK